MSNISDFVIENGVLTRYTGPGGDVVIPEGVWCVGELAFAGQTNCVTVTIPEGVTKIDEEAFSGCTALISIVIPEGVIEIGYEAFCGCTALTSIVIPESTTWIYSNAFCGCTALTIRTPTGSWAEACAREHGIPFSNSGSPALPKTDFIIENGVLIRYTGPGGDVVIPVGVDHISENAFASTAAPITSVAFPHTMNDIDMTPLLPHVRNLENISISRPEAKVSLQQDSWPFHANICVWEYGCTVKICFGSNTITVSSP